MTYTRVKIPYKSWSPPELSLEDELSLGKHIAEIGRKNFVDEFNRKLYKQHSSEAQNESPASPVRVFVTVLVLVVIAFLLFAYAPRELIARVVAVTTVALIVWFGSIAWTSNKFDRWVNRLLAQYAEHQAKSHRRNPSRRSGQW